MSMFIAASHARGPNVDQQDLILFAILGVMFLIGGFLYLADRRDKRKRALRSRQMDRELDKLINNPKGKDR